MEVTVPATSANINDRCYDRYNRGVSEKDAIHASERHLSDEINDASRVGTTNVSDNTSRVIKEIGESNRFLTGEVSGVHQHMASDFRSLSAEVGKLGHAGELAAVTAKYESILSSVREGEKGVEMTQRQAAHTRENLAQGFKEVALQACGNTDEIIRNSKDGFSAATVQVALGFKDDLIAFKEAQSLAFQLAAASERTAASNASAAALTAASNTAAVLAAQAACCCELKELIRADGEKTRDLVGQIDRERAARDLVEAQQEILYLKGKLPAGTPV